VHVRAVEVPYENPIEVRPAANAINGQVLEPGVDELPEAYREVLDDEVVVIHRSSPACEPVIFWPYHGVQLPGVLDDVGRCDIPAQGLIELIEYSCQQVATSFPEANLERTLKLSVLGLEQFRDG